MRNIFFRRSVAIVAGIAGCVSYLTRRAGAARQPNPRQQPGAQVTMFAPEQHDLYDGHYVLSANRIYMVGGLNDAPGWDHLDNDAVNVKPVAGTVEIDVDELKNTGKFEARLKIPEGDLVLAMDRFHEFNPCQHGGIAGVPPRTRHRLGMRRHQLAQSVRLSRRLGIRSRDAERQAALRQLRNAFHGDAGHPRSKDAEGELPDGRQETARGRSEPSDAADRFLHSEPADQPEEQTESRGLPALLRHGSTWK